MILITLMLLAAPPVSDNESKGWHHKPVRLEADGKPIDRGAAWAHCGPTHADVDGDGKLDLVVGDFGGTFTFYRNIGTNTAPRYLPGKPLLADGDSPHGQSSAVRSTVPPIADSSFWTDLGRFDARPELSHA